MCQQELLQCEDPPVSSLTGPNAFNMVFVAKGRYLHADKTCDTVSRPPQMLQLGRPNTCYVRAPTTNLFHSALRTKSHFFLIKKASS